MKVGETNRTVIGYGGVLFGIETWSYLFLLLLSLLIISIAYGRYSNHLLIALYFAVSGITLFFDYIIYVWGFAYIYHPEFIDGKYDTHLGALVNAQILPSFALLYIALQCRWYWSVLLAAFFAGVEVFFTKVGAFETKWWSVWYTFSILIFYFPIIQIWWKRLSRGPGKLLSYATLVAVSYCVHIQLLVFLYGVIESRTYHVGWIEQFGRDSNSLSTVIAISVGILLAALRVSKARTGWYVLLLGGFIVFDLLLKYFGIVAATNVWLDSFLFVLACTITMIFVRVAGNTIEKH